MLAGARFLADLPAMACDQCPHTHESRLGSSVLLPGVSVSVVSSWKAERGQPDRPWAFGTVQRAAGVDDYDISCRLSRAGGGCKVKPVEAWAAGGCVTASDRSRFLQRQDRLSRSGHSLLLAHDGAIAASSIEHGRVHYPGTMKSIKKSLVRAPAPRRVHLRVDSHPHPPPCAL
jgi:hypothetical protein